MDSCSDCVIDLLFNSPFINGFLLLEENDMSIFHMNIHIVPNYYVHVYQAVHFDSCQSPVALFPRWGGGGGGSLVPRLSHSREERDWERYGRQTVDFHRKKSGGSNQIAE